MTEGYFQITTGNPGYPVLKYEPGGALPNSPEEYLSNLQDENPDAIMPERIHAIWYGADGVIRGKSGSPGEALDWARSHDHEMRLSSESEPCSCDTNDHEPRHDLWEGCTAAWCYCEHLGNL